ncbi:MAG TPA: GNAT family N-acetyltransferase [Ilumatobacter sp.]
MSSVRLATPHDVGRLALTGSLAFADDPVLRWFFPDDGEYHELSPILIGVMARRWLAVGSLWCTDDGVAMAGWQPPGRPEVEPDRRPAIDHPPWRLERFAAIGEAFAQHTPAEAHWYLNMLATHPDWQRQGLGAALMAVVFEQADSQGLACYLETQTPANVAYYRHHGFEVRSEWDLRTAADVGPHMWGMLRPPAGR